MTKREEDVASYGVHRVRLEVRLVGVLLVLSLYGCATAPPLPSTPLFAGLRGKDWEEPEASNLLRQRIGERFPIGAPEAGLAEYLSSQGMKPGAAASSFGPATRESRSYWAGSVGLCRMPVQVAWHVDGAGRLSKLSVFYSDTSCL